MNKKTHNRNQNTIKGTNLIKLGLTQTCIEINICMSLVYVFSSVCDFRFVMFCLFGGNVLVDMEQLNKFNIKKPLCKSRLNANNIGKFRKTKL